MESPKIACGVFLSCVRGSSGMMVNHLLLLISPTVGQRLRITGVTCRKSRTGADQLSACEVVDSLTVRFTFKKALPANKWNIDFPIMPSHVYRELEKNDPTLEADG